MEIIDNSLSAKESNKGDDVSEATQNSTSKCTSENDLDNSSLSNSELVKAPPIPVNAPVAVVLFAGGGGVECGMIEAGINPKFSVELDPNNESFSDKIIKVHKYNFLKFGCKLLRSTVEELGEAGFAGLPYEPDYLHSSNVCKNFSRAKGIKVKDREKQEDIDSAKAVAIAIRRLQPKNFTLEQVEDFIGSKSFKEITKALEEEGYTYYYSVVNFADYGLPQSRKRLIIRAGKESVLPLPPLQENRVGWYKAVEHLVPDMQSSNLISKQQKAVEEWRENNKPEPLLVQRVGIRENCSIRPGSMPATTVISSHFKDDKGNSRKKFADIRFPDGSAKSLSIEAVKVLQGFPDWYQFPEGTPNAIAGTILGNAVPPSFAKQLFSQTPKPVHKIKERQVWAISKEHNPAVVISVSQDEIEVVYPMGEKAYTIKPSEFESLSCWEYEGFREYDDVVVIRGKHLGKVGYVEDKEVYIEDELVGFDDLVVINREEPVTAAIAFSDNCTNQYKEYAEYNNWEYIGSYPSELYKEFKTQEELNSYIKEFVEEEEKSFEWIALLGTSNLPESLRDFSSLEQDKYEVLKDDWEPPATKTEGDSTYLRIDRISTDTSTQSRVALDDETVEEYKHLVIEGEVDFPPITVFSDGKEFYIADGWHRYFANVASNSTWIKAEIKEGGIRDAILYSVGANASHGLRRTSADKRKSVQTLLNDEEWCQWSNRFLAEKAGVSEGTIRNYRNNPELCAQITHLEKRKAIKNGKQITYNVTATHRKRDIEVFPRQVISEKGLVVVTHKQEDGTYVTDSGEILRASSITEVPENEEITTTKQEEKAIAKSFGLKTGEELIPSSKKDEFNEEDFGKVAFNQARINELANNAAYITSSQQKEIISLIHWNKLDLDTIMELQKLIDKILSNRVENV